MKKFFSLIFSLSVLCAAYAQTTNISGKVVDELGMPLIGASVTVEGTTFGTTTDIDGIFILKADNSSSEVLVSYMGYEDKKIAVKNDRRLGNITLEPSAIAMEDILITQSVAIVRKTPVAVSTVTAEYIAERLGTLELPEVLNTTPGVYAHKQGGGYGDSEIRMRGFEQANVAVMINGMPINDMEWGGTYWSNWMGLADVTRSMQTQRGLGMSRISSPSVGGSINIVTAGLETKKGGSVFYSVGNDGASNVGFSVSSGLNERGWALTMLGSQKSGDGWVQGTEYKSSNYFISIAKRLTSTQQLNFTAFGAPQEHYQRSSRDGQTIANWYKVQDYMGNDNKYKYNPTYGFGKNGERKTSSYNQYHKPLISLNHQWQISPAKSLSTVLYTSFGIGNGYSGQGRDGYSYSDWYGSSNGKINTKFRAADGTFDYAAIQDMNEQSTAGSKMIMSKSINNHWWYGILSNYTHQINDNITYSGGIDARYYIGQHTNEIIDLYNGTYFMDDSSRKGVKAENNAAAANPMWRYEKLHVGDVVYRDYDGHIGQAGLFGQLEYSSDLVTSFISGSYSHHSYYRVDRLYYDAEHAESQHANFDGFTLKAGANYNMTEHSNVFANVGYISRAPFFSGGVFLSAAVSNAINPDAVNEKVVSAEVGYGYHSQYLNMNVNVYYTNWKDKTMARSKDDVQFGDGTTGRYTINMTGVDALHKGVEFDFTAKPVFWLDIQGMFSWGDWIWNSNAKGYFYDGLGHPLKYDENGNFISASEVAAEDHLSSTINQKGIHVSGAPQTTASLSAVFKPLKSLRFGCTYNLYARLYSSFSISLNDITPESALVIKQPWVVPTGGQMDLFANYRFKFGNLDSTLSVNVNNLLDQEYISFSYDGGDHTANTAYVLYALGRTYTVKLKINF